MTLAWTDASSGVPTGGTSYRVNDGNPIVYVNPFTVSAQGSTKLTYRSIDRALNAEATQTAYVNIDETSPTVSAATAPPGNSGWYNTDVVVTLTGVDARRASLRRSTALQRIRRCLWVDAASNQFTVLASVNAVQTFDYQAVDKAGNVSAPGTLELKMDSVKPQASGKAASGTHGKNITLKYKFTDNMSPSATGAYVKITKSNGKVVKNQKHQRHQDREHVVLLQVEGRREGDLQLLRARHGPRREHVEDDHGEDHGEVDDSESSACGEGRGARRGSPPLARCARGCSRARSRHAGAVVQSRALHNR